MTTDKLHKFHVSWCLLDRCLLIGSKSSLRDIFGCENPVVLIRTRLDTPNHISGITWDSNVQGYYSSFIIRNPDLPTRQLGPCPGPEVLETGNLKPKLLGLHFEKFPQQDIYTTQGETF